MIEVFSDRMETTNPGLPLVKTDRFLDSPHRSRNELLASVMRRAGIREALEDGRIRAFDPSQGKKYAKYVPFWA